VIRNKIENMVDAKISEEEAGFATGKSCSEDIFFFNK
jgi:hypothetical protein